MSRAFLKASSEFLSLDSAILTAVPISVSMWVKTDNGDADQEIWNLGAATDNSVGFGLSLEATGDVVKAYARSGAGSQSAQTLTSFSIASVWEHVGGEFASSTSRYAFLHGVRSPENIVSRTPTGLDTTGVGGRFRAGGSNFLNGSLVDVAVWNGLLTDAEWLMLAAGISPLKVRPDVLVMYLPLIGDENTELIGGTIWTVNGTPTKDTNPRLIRPSAQILQFPSVAGGAPVSSIMIPPFEASAEVLDGYVSSVEALQELVPTFGSSLEALVYIAALRQVPIGALQSIDSNKTMVLEALQDVLQTSTAPFEALTSITQSRQAVLEALQGLSQSRQLVIESPLTLLLIM